MSNVGQTSAGGVMPEIDDPFYTPKFLCLKAGGAALLRSSLEKLPESCSAAHLARTCHTEAIRLSLGTHVCFL